LGLLLRLPVPLVAQPGRVRRGPVRAGGPAQERRIRHLHRTGRERAGVGEAQRREVRPDRQQPDRAHAGRGGAEHRPDPADGGQPYCPVNANPPWMNGPRNMWTGLGRSVNTYWVPLEYEIGAQNAVNAAKQLGFQFRASRDADLANDANGWGAFTLGVSAATPL